MHKLVLKFENSVLKEASVGRTAVRIGRSPHNALVIDNPAVSHYHARVFSEAGRLMLEDCGSLNGTFVNGQRVKTTMLRPGDEVRIGKHTMVIRQSYDRDGDSADNSASLAVPKIGETVILGTRERSEFLKNIAAQGENSQVAPERVKLATLMVLAGKTNQQEYLLCDALTVIGKSAMATVRLRRWFAPKAAAQINRRKDTSYYVGTTGPLLKINGQATTRPTKLLPGDVFEVAGTKFEFCYRD